MNNYILLSACLVVLSPLYQTTVLPHFELLPLYLQLGDRVVVFFVEISNEGEQGKPVPLLLCCVYAVFQNRNWSIAVNVLKSLLLSSS